MILAMAIGRPVFVPNAPVAATGAGLRATTTKVIKTT
jgi:hypothetical protein